MERTVESLRRETTAFHILEIVEKLTGRNWNLSADCPRLADGLHVDTNENHHYSLKCINMNPSSTAKCVALLDAEFNGVLTGFRRVNNSNATLIYEFYLV